jgi:hypothetical protein
MRGREGHKGTTDLPERNILLVHPLDGLQGQVELRAISVPAVVGHADQAAFCVRYGERLICKHNRNYSEPLRRNMSERVRAFEEPTERRLSAISPA